MKTWHWFQPLSFQLLWLCAVLGGNQWIIASFCLLCLHFIFSPYRQQDVRILPLAFIGIAVDSLLTWFDIFSFSQPPIWLLLLWFSFVLNFGHSFKQLRKLNIVWLMTIGAIGGSYAYLISWKLNAVDLPLGSLLSICVIAFAWAVIFPILVKADLYIRGSVNE